MGNVIEIKNLSKKINQDIWLMNNFNLQIKGGDFVCVFGNGGVGKTTLLNLIAGIESEYDGKISVLGVDRRELKNSDVKISYVMKTPVLLENLSVEDNLAYVFFSKYKKLSVKDRLILDDAIGKFELDKVRKVRAKKLKLWQKKVVNLARAFCKNSQIVLVDELFFGVNSENFLALKNALLLLAGDKSKTVVCVENVPIFAFFNYSKFVYMSFCKNFGANSLNLLKEKIDDISAYFLVNYRREFSPEAISEIKNRGCVHGGQFCSFTNIVKLDDGTEFVVDNADFVKIYQSDSLVKLYEVDSFFFDHDTRVLVGRR